MVLILAIPCSSYGTEPLDARRIPVDQVIALLKDPKYQNPEQKELQREKIVYLSQNIASGSKARVKTKIVSTNMDIPVNYNMIKRNGSWKVYDVNIEGVSLIKNYRSQFNQILSKDSPTYLIERLKRKIEIQKKKRSEKN